ncbi:MAG: hypothetical protein HXY19_04825 [Thermoanaerobaculaceae bacterium]|nr:hypothetical protein [Thermoanaerobaculaceae bacterium]
MGVDADASTADVLEQVEVVAQALEENGIPHRVAEVPFASVWEALRPGSGEVVFSLLEAPPGAPHLQAAATAVLELSGLPFTGSGSSAIWLTTDKVATRAVLAAEGVAVAPGAPLRRGDASVFQRIPPPWILKPAREDASLGLDGDAVAVTREQAEARAEELSTRFPGQPILVEHLLPGREFNVSILEREGAPWVLPVAEMDFSGLPAGTPPIVSYEAKWEERHAAFRGTVRRFPEGGDEGDLLAAVQAVALQAWHLTGLAGYARVDIRLDEGGTPCVLEVNANPCLAPDAGFLAAAAQAHLTPAAVIAHIVAAARRARGAS